MNIRRASRDDLGAVAELHRGEGWCYDEELVLRDYWDDCFDRESILVAETRENGIDGTLEVAKAYKARFGYFAVIRRFVIHPEFRGRGIGRTLFQYATEEAKRMGCTAIELSVDPENGRPHKFYQSLGFKDDRTEIIMVKSLTEDSGDGSK
jgi:ribosomal protein S18 acetylase RimI-like enzyme